MRKWTSRVGMVVGVGGIVAAVVLQACNTVNKRDGDLSMQENAELRRRLAAEQLARQNAETRGASLEQENRNIDGDGAVGFAPSKPGEWSAIGFQQDSMGLSSGTAPKGVPTIDLQDALRASQGGGGREAGQSLFGQDTNYGLGTLPGLSDPSKPGAAPPHRGFGKRSSWRFPADGAEPAAPAENERSGRGPAEFILRPGDELWVIEKRTVAAPPQSDDVPGCGVLMTQARERPADRPESPEDQWPSNIIAVPLKHTDVQARIDGYIGTVKVTQQFVNPYTDKIEAVYVFPLPENAAVNDFLMTIGGRTIRGIIREREEAQQIYAEAKRQGYAASLLTQERPNIFMQHVANIEPGKEIDVEVRYFHTLAYRDGWFEWAFPMVVGPRYNPSCSRDGVGAVARGSYGQSGQVTEVQYLRPRERSGHDVAVHVDLDAGVPIESVQSPSHQVAVHAAASPCRAGVDLSVLDTIPNKDFVLRWKVAGRDVKSAMLTQVDGRGGFFSMMLVPPADLQYVERGPVEMVFVVDCSGSMDGEPIAQAKRAVEHALAALDKDDTFQIIDFAERASQLGAEPLPATYENVRRGLAFVQGLHAGGGTEMLNGLAAALKFRHDPRRLRFVCFLTDGYIGNEADILTALKKDLGETRVFTMGMGTAPNRFLLEGMARLGRGVAGYALPGDDAGEIMDRFFERVSHVALTDLKIDWGGLEVSDVYPKELPDLFVGRPVIITGRYKGAGQTQIKVTGRVGRQKLPIMVPADLDGRDGPRASLAAVWARARIAELSDLSPGAGERRVEQVRKTALEFGLMSAYTSFVAVDSMTRAAAGLGTTVEVPVPAPEGVNYQTTVHERPRTVRRPGEDR